MRPQKRNSYPPTFFGAAIALCIAATFACPAHAGDPDDTSLTYRHIAVEERDGKVLSVTPLPESEPPAWANGVRQERWNWQGNGPSESDPYFQGPIPFVVPPTEASGEPFYPHNHQPSIAWLDNGDMLAIWYSTITEQGTELTVLASRLRAGNDTWDPSSEFFKAADRNMHGSSLFHAGAGVVLHMNGMGRAGVGRKQDKALAMLCRISRDNGQSWSAPTVVGPEYLATQQLISGASRTRDGALLQPCDVTRPKGSNFSALHISRDNGKTWINPAGAHAGSFIDDGATEGPVIAGIHAGVVELTDGRLMALARRHDIDGRMPVSYSSDSGATWHYRASPFSPIGGGQRNVFMRLQEGPLLLVSFTDKRNPDKKQGMPFQDQAGKEFTGFGMFGALSFDDGATWPVRKLITPGKGEFDGGAWTGPFTASPTNAEHGGYLAGTQSPDGVIHIISSRLHYRFNVAWLKAPAWEITGKQPAP